jgi:MFS family permease
MSFILFSNFYLLLSSRFLTGFFQVFQTIYFPVWSDRFGKDDKQKTIFLTCYFLTAPMGVLFGYIISAWFISTVGWRYSFVLQSVCFMPIVIAICVTPARYLNLNKPEPQTEPLSSPLGSENEFLFLSPKSFHNQAHQEQLSPVPNERSTITLVKQLLTKKLFVCLALALSGLFFIITGIQYWISDYLQIVYGVRAEEVYYYFAITCLTAPFMGVVVNGFIITSMGGYNNPKSFTLCVVVASLGMFTALPIPFLTSKYLTYSLIWLLLFNGAFLVPTLTGIMLNSVEESKKTTANSLATLGYNLFGYLPAPVIYGFVSCRGSDAIFASRQALGCIMYWSIFILMMIGTGYWHWIS